MTAKIVETQGVFANDTEWHFEIDGERVPVDDLVAKYNKLDELMQSHLDIVFTAPPGPANECVFVEVERDGYSLNVGQWLDHPDGYATLRITPADFGVQPQKTLKSRPTPQQVLDTPMDDHSNTAGASTVRGYLVMLLVALWEQKEQFGGKRPFGESGWQYDFYVALGKAGYIAYREDANGDIDHVDKALANILIEEAIDALMKES